MAGRIILLHGASSSGKSSIARALQTRIETPFWRLNPDHLRDAGALPLDRFFRSREFRWADYRDAWFRGFELALPAYLGAGNDLIVDYILETEPGVRRFVATLAGFDVFFVGVRCPLDELERREAVRGDRRIGDASRDFETIHNHCVYDLELDSTLPPDANAETLLAAWRARSRPSAFEKMAAALA
jgi:chloramphenicol 3-O phosphotransferase